VRILIYATAARMGGARTHVVGLVPELASIAPSDQVLLLAQPDLIGELPSLPDTWLTRAERAQVRGFVGRFIWEQRVLPRIAERWRADVLLSFGSFVPLRSPCPTVLEAGNALPFTPGYWQVLAREPLRVRMEERARWALLRASLHAAQRILAPTHAMRQDVVTRLPGLGRKVDVALWGVAAIFRKSRWRDPAGGMVAGISKHGINKEFDVLVEALTYLRPEARDARLVLTGTPEESRWSRRTQALAGRLGVADRVTFAGNVRNADVPSLIQQARLVVFPTWCESFGLPLAEALAMGAPAVAADIPACREVGADGAYYYAPGDAKSLADAMDALLGYPEGADSLARRAHARGAEFSWRNNALGVRDSLLKAVA
jgi:glycosyltransferase involved in cell wall biosynthesis